MTTTRSTSISAELEAIDRREDRERKDAGERLWKQAAVTSLPDSPPADPEEVAQLRVDLRTLGMGRSEFETWVSKLGELHRTSPRADVKAAHIERTRLWGESRKAEQKVAKLQAQLAKLQEDQARLHSEGERAVNDATSARSACDRLATELYALGAPGCIVDWTPGEHLKPDVRVRVREGQQVISGSRRFVGGDVFDTIAGPGGAIGSALELVCNLDATGQPTDPAEDVPPPTELPDPEQVSELRRQRQAAAVARLAGQGGTGGAGDGQQPVEGYSSATD